MTRHSFSNCSCLLAEMSNSPSAVVKVPDSAAVPTREGAPPDGPAGRQASGFSIDAAVTRSVSAPVISAYRAYPTGEASHRRFA